MLHGAAVVCSRSGSAVAARLQGSSTTQLHDTPPRHHLPNNTAHEHNTHDITAGDRRPPATHTQAVPGYDAAQYACERQEALAADGTKIPISLVYRKDARAAAQVQVVGWWGCGRGGCRWSVG